MIFNLRRNAFLEDGIFGELQVETADEIFSCQTLEHAYLEDGEYKPKVPAGIYTCKRGFRRLAIDKKPFWTYEVTQVPGHTGILFHVGNFNKDSSGCILLGTELSKINNEQIITNSKKAFADFMLFVGKIKEFTLKVS